MDGPILVTGGAGFIGSAVVRRLVADGRRVVNVDKLTYAGNLESLADVAGDPAHIFEPVDICDAAEIARVMSAHRPTAVLHLAAESHVDRSIDGPVAFVHTNVVGTLTLLQAARDYLQADPSMRDSFRFVHVSTDEVFGSLGAAGRFDDESPYDPRSPYSASKAASDHLARAWLHTYGLPVIVTNCSNNYGPHQFPEKLVPLTILNALEGRPLPVYGNGENIRDWIFVEDHVDGLLAALQHGAPGGTYLFGGEAERRNIDVVRAVCRTLDRMIPATTPHESLITFVTDRPGHDFRYAIDSTRARNELGWEPRHAFEAGLAETVRWYVENRPWAERVQSGAYRRERLGLAGISPQ